MGHNKIGTENGDPLGHNKKTRDLLAENSSDSAVQIQRYIRLTHLSPELLKRVDLKIIPFQAAVNLSYLPLEKQKYLETVLQELGCSVSLAQSRKMKEKEEENQLTEVLLRYILEEKINKPQKIALKVNTQKYFPENTSKSEMEKVIESLLEKWKREQE